MQQTILAFFVGTLLVWPAAINCASPATDTQLAGRGLDPEAIFALFSFHQQIAADLDRLSKTDPGKAEQLLHGACSLLQVDQSGFSAIGDVGRSLRVRLAALDRESLQLILAAQKAGRVPELSVMKAFEDRRNALLRDALKELERQLSESNKIGLATYVSKSASQHTGLRNPGGKGGQ